MRTYRRLTYEDRCQMYALRKAGKTQAEIGQALGLSQGTVCRELARNTGRRGYRFQQAQRLAQARQQAVRHRPRKLTRRVRLAIARKLRTERWSPPSAATWRTSALPGCSPTKPPASVPVTGTMTWPPRSAPDAP